MKVLIRVKPRLPGVFSMALIQGSIGTLCLLASVSLKSAAVESPQWRPAIPAETSLVIEPVEVQQGRKQTISTSRLEKRSRCGILSETELASIIGAAATRHGVNQSLIREVVDTESKGNPCLVSPRGAAGLMQLMPSTASTLRVKNVFDPEESIEGGTKVLKTLLARYGNDLTLTLAAYNAGPGNVDRYGGVPPFPETRRYVHGILLRVARKQVSPPIASLPVSLKP